MELTRLGRAIQKYRKIGHWFLIGTPPSLYNYLGEAPSHFYNDSYGVLVFARSHKEAVYRYEQRHGTVHNFYSLSQRPVETSRDHSRYSVIYRYEAGRKIQKVKYFH